MNKSKLKIASFFAGIGGFDYAAQKAGDFETVYANEISRRAYETFEMNFPLEVDKRSIWDIKPEELPDFDVLCGGFPCQSFSSAGRQAGRQDARCRLSYALLPMIAYKKPRVIFLENVKGLLNHDKGQFLFDILQELADLGYFVKWKLINAKHYGPPQNRERVYFVGFRNFCEYNNFYFPNTESTFEERCQRKLECVDLNKTVESCYYADVNTRTGKRIFGFAKLFGLLPGDFFCWRIDKFCFQPQDIFYCFTHKASFFDGMTSLIDNAGRVRSLTAKEVIYIQGFLQDYKFNEALSPRVIFGLIGNSVSIWVVKLIFEQIAEALSNGQHEQK